MLSFVNIEINNLRKPPALQLKRSKATITRCNLSPDSFTLMPRNCANLKAIRYESKSLYYGEVEDPLRLYRGKDCIEVFCYHIEEEAKRLAYVPGVTNCAPLLADFFLYSYENEFLDKLIIKEGKRKLARKFNLSYHHIGDLISYNNKRFNEFISDIYPQRNSPFLILRNLLQLLLISTYFLLEMRTTTLPPN